LSLQVVVQAAQTVMQTQATAAAVLVDIAHLLLESRLVAAQVQSPRSHFQEELRIQLRLALVALVRLPRTEYQVLTQYLDLLLQQEAVAGVIT